MDPSWKSGHETTGCSFRTPPDRSDLDAGIRWGAAENIAQLGEVASPKPFFRGFFFVGKKTWNEKLEEKSFREVKKSKVS